MLLCFVRSQMFTFVQINRPVALFINLNYAKRIPNIRLANFKLKYQNQRLGNGHQIRQCCLLYDGANNTMC